MRTDVLRLALLAMVGFGGCSGSDDAVDPTNTETTPVSIEVSAVTAAPAPAMGTVIDVAWTSSEAAAGFVRFTPQGEAARTTALDGGGTDHAHTLVGVPPGAAVDLELVHVIGGEEIVAHSKTVTAGVLPNAPTLTLQGTSDRFLALTFVDETSTIVVVDPQGRVVWAYEDTSGLSVFRAHIAVDGSGIIYAATLSGGKPSADSYLVYVPWSGEGVRTVPVPYLAHDFVELDDGTIVSLAYEFRDVPALGGGVEGNRLVRVAPDGTIEDNVWSAWDCYDPEVNLSIDLEHGWIHANALDYDAAADRYLVGMRNLTTIAQVDLGSRSCEWGFGGSGGTVDIEGPEFFHQHQFERTPGGMLVFDNDGAAGFESRVLEFSFDGGDTAEHVRTISMGLYSFILGDVHRLDGGDTLVTWSVPSIVQRIDESDQIVWSVTADNDAYVFGFTEVAVDPGRPDLGVQH